jgi:hypothetical protein
MNTRLQKPPSISVRQDAWLEEIMDSAVRHLKAFAREADLKPHEWLEAIKFLSSVGQWCTEFRQEFILLSDTLGLSARVATITSTPTRCSAYAVR